MLKQIVPLRAKSLGSEASCRPLTDPASVSWPAVVQEVSTSGICLLLPRRFEPGVLLVVQLGEGAEKTLITLVIQVKRVHAQGSTRWAVSGAFPRRLTEDELDGLL